MKVTDVSAAPAGGMNPAGTGVVRRSGRMAHLGNPAVRQEILQRIAGLRPETQPVWGRMSAHQMLCHLTDSFRVAMGEKEASAAGGLLQRSLVKWVALYMPSPWPHGVPTRPEVEQGVGGTAPSDFRSDRIDLIFAIERFSDPNRDFRWAVHPIFGRLSEREWLRWGYLHTDHHLRQFAL